MRKLCKAFMFAMGGVIVYAVANKVVEKVYDQQDQDEIEDIADEVMDELEDSFDEVVVENVICRIGKEIRAHMVAQTSVVKEKVGFCKEVLNNAQNRLTIGIVVLAAGVGIGGGLIASAYIKLPE